VSPHAAGAEAFEDTAMNPFALSFFLSGAHMMALTMSYSLTLMRDAKPFWLWPAPPIRR
jgi:hypothetical protein